MNWCSLGGVRGGNAMNKRVEESVDTWGELLIFLINFFFFFLKIDKFRLQISIFPKKVSHILVSQFDK